MSNIFDIAALAGVSKTTVSKVLNNQYGVKDATRQKVLEAAKQLNYIPNHAAKSLVTNKSGVIGVIGNASFKTSVYIDLSITLQKYAEEMGYTLVFCNYNDDISTKSKYVSYFMSGAADGMIFFGSDKEDKALVEYIKASSYPLVVIENYFEDIKINNILIDNIKGSKSVIEYLSGLGHKKIAYITGNMEQRVASDRLNGYMRALQENNLPFISEYIIYSLPIIGSGKTSIEKILALKDKPTALYFFNDVMAYEAIWELQRLGYQIPKDFSIVGFDNFAGTFDFFKNSISLTSVAQPIDAISKASIDLLVNTIKNKNANYEQLSFETSLVKGNSCRQL